MDGLASVFETARTMEAEASQVALRTQRDRAALEMEQERVRQEKADLEARWSELRRTQTKMAVESPEPSPTSGTRAPKGQVAFVFTDIQDSTLLWNTCQDLMRVALDAHNDTLRKLIFQNSGYEVKTEGDSFMVAFRNVTDALMFCVGAQSSLMKVSWSPDLLKFEGIADSTPDGLWNGLRVRMGLHVGDVRHEIDPTTNRTDYYGPTVNRAARVAGLGEGGEILISKEVQRALSSMSMMDYELMEQLQTHVHMKSVGRRALKGFQKSEDDELFRVLPRHLSGRVFKRDLTNGRRTLKPADLRVQDTWAVVYTRLPTSEQLWKYVPPPVMMAALSEHDKILQDIAHDHEGYEANLLPEGAVLVFHTVDQALQFCLAVQEELTRHRWHSSILSEETVQVNLDLTSTSPRLQLPDPPPDLGGLHVGMSLALGSVMHREDPTTRSFKCCGPAVSEAERNAHQLQECDFIVLSSSAATALQASPLSDHLHPNSSPHIRIVSDLVPQNFPVSHTSIAVGPDEPSSTPPVTTPASPLISPASFRLWKGEDGLPSTGPPPPPPQQPPAGGSRTSRPRGLSGRGVMTARARLEGRPVRTHRGPRPSAIAPIPAHKPRKSSKNLPTVAPLPPPVVPPPPAERRRTCVLTPPSNQVTATASVQVETPCPNCTTHNIAVHTPLPVETHIGPAPHHLPPLHESLEVSVPEINPESRPKGTRKASMGKSDRAEWEALMHRAKLTPEDIQQVRKLGVSSVRDLVDVVAGRQGMPRLAARMETALGAPKTARLLKIVYGVANQVERPVVKKVGDTPLVGQQGGFLPSLLPPAGGGRRVPPRMKPLP